jgi:dTDP-4-dehydrorhamnose reductase
MLWAITGGAGQLGKAMALALKMRGIDYVAYRSKDLDIRSPISIRSAFAQSLPSVVVNAAAWTNVDRAESEPDSAFSVNAEGVLNLAIATKEVGAVFAQISTDYVFSGKRLTPWLEGDEQNPASIYGESKAKGELAVLANYPEASYIFRTAWLYSPWGQNFAKTMTRLALNGNEPVRVVGDQIGQPTSALDVANQIIDAISMKLPFGIYHATNAGHASWFEFAGEIFRLCDANVNRLIQINSSEILRPANRPAYSVLGHDAWDLPGATGENIPAMRNWLMALKEIMPDILSEVRSES